MKSDFGYLSGGSKQEYAAIARGSADALTAIEKALTAKTRSIKLKTQSPDKARIAVLDDMGKVSHKSKIVVLDIFW